MFFIYLKKTKRRLRTLGRLQAGDEFRRAEEARIVLGRPEKAHLISGRVVDGATGQPLSGVLIGYRANIPAGGGLQGFLQSDSQSKFEI